MSGVRKNKERGEKVNEQELLEIIRRGRRFADALAGFMTEIMK